MKLNINAFSTVRYIGTQSGTGVTDFSSLKLAVKNELENTAVRAARSPVVIYTTLKVIFSSVFISLIIYFLVGFE